MKTRYVVEVNGASRPVLPEVCIVCGKSAGEPLRTLPLSDEYSRVEFYFYRILEEPAQGALLDVRVHDRCARSVRNRFVKGLLSIVAVATAIAAAGILMGFDGLLAIVAALVAATPFLYRQLSSPVPIEFWHYGGKYVLVFEDRRLADRVARLNEAEVMVCANAWSGVPLELRSATRTDRLK